LNQFASCYSKPRKALSFSFAFIEQVIPLKLDEKEGAGKVFSQTRKTTIVVDVDDKNCLAELTVALKLNQGPGNGCKSLPVCFSLGILS